MPKIAGCTGMSLPYHCCSMCPIYVAAMFDRPGQMMAVQPLLTSGSALMMSMWRPGTSPTWTQTVLGANTPLVPSTFQPPSRYTRPPNCNSKDSLPTVFAELAVSVATDTPSFLPSATFAMTLVRSLHRQNCDAVLSTLL